MLIDTPTFVVHRRVVEGEETADAMSDAELAVLVGSLRPATSVEWHAFLETADHVARGLARADALADLLDPSAPPSRPTSSSTTSTTTTTTSEVSSGSNDPTGPIIGSDATGLVSAVGIERPHAPHPLDQFSDLSGLEIRLELDSTTIRPGDVTGAWLLLRNTSDAPVGIGECTLIYARWGVLPETQSADPPEIAGDHCVAIPRETVPAGETVRLPFTWHQPHGFVAQRLVDGDNGGRFLGTLPAGRYAATVIIPGSTFDVRLSLAVTVPEAPCSPADADASYLDLTLAAAKKRAERAGTPVRVISIDGVGQPRNDDLRCSRVNLVIDQDRVTSAIYF